MPRAPLLALLVLAGGTSAFSGSHYRLVDRPGTPLYYGHVGSCDLPVYEGVRAEVIRGQEAEAATVNTPLGPGDRLVTPVGVRCEAEFDTGTVVQLDGESGLRIETVLASALSTSGKLTNLTLEAGRARVFYRDYDGSEVFQILTGQAAVKLGRSALVDVTVEQAGETRIAVERGEAAVLFGPNERQIRRRTLDAGDQLAVVDHHQMKGRSEVLPDTFARWARARDGARVPPATDGRPLPATLRSLPPAVRDFAERFSRTHGSWVWTRGKEHAWRPHASGDPEWRPFLRGRFTALQGQAFWVADEPWGWVPYHLGFWDLDDDAGWVWLPGSTFAPAWVTWMDCDELHAWTAFGVPVWRRYRATGMPFRPPYCGDSSFVSYRFPWSDQWSEAPAARPPQFAKRRGAPGPAPTEPARPAPERPRLPPELRGLGGQLDRMAARRESARSSDEAVFQVRETPLRSEGEGARETRALPDAAREFRGVGRPAAPVEAAAPAPPGGPSGPGGSVAPRDRAPATPGRFRDWNPDVRAAREAGVSIRYDSASNQVICDGCQALAARGGAGTFATAGSGSGFASGADGASGATSAAASAAGPGAGGGAASARSGPIER